MCRASRQELESLFVSRLPTIEKIFSALARRHGLSSDAAEFSASAKRRMIENDYGILAKFRGEASLPTYLTVVLSMLFREYRVLEWGRWRPSAAAKRGGWLAIRLEQLVSRDGLSVGQAGDLLRTAGFTTLADAELGRIAALLPTRAPLPPVQSGHSSTEVAGSPRAGDVIDAEETDRTAGTVTQVLGEALDTLPSDDRLIVQLHYGESKSIADIARELALPQESLYRRVERTLGVLRSFLERSGISRDHVRPLTTG